MPKISELPAGSAVTGTEMIPAVQNGATVKLTVAQIGAGVSCWGNNRLAKTANYTLANADKSSTVALGGSGFFTLTVSAASGYDANFVAMIANEDTGRGKLISINGYSSFILWPDQSFLLFNQNNVWQFNPPGKWKLTASVTFNTNHASGVDANNDGLGTGAGAFATINNAKNVIQAQIDANGFVASIQNAAETFSESVTFLGFAQTGSNSPGIPITGSPATPGNTIWQVPIGQNNGLVVRDSATVALSGFKLVGLGSGQTGVSVSQGGVVDFQNMEFGLFTGGSHLSATAGGILNYNGGTYVVSGNMSQHIFSSGPSQTFIPGATISVPNALTFSNWYQGQLGASFQIFSTTFTGTGSGAGSTGAKYNLSINASAQLNGTTLPGASAGSTSTGGNFTA